MKRSTPLAALALGAILLSGGTAYAEDVYFDQEVGKGDIVRISIINDAAITVDSVVIKQDGHGGYAKVDRRHKQNLGGRAGDAVISDGFGAYIYQGCHYIIKFKPTSACTKGDRDLSLPACMDKKDLTIKLQGDCLVNGLKVKAFPPDPKK